MAQEREAYMKKKLPMPSGEREAVMKAKQPRRVNAQMFRKRTLAEMQERDPAPRAGETKDETEARNTRPGLKVKPPMDINLPDESAGKHVGDIDVSDIPDGKGGTFRHSKPIMGGDPDDPRWAEMRARKREMLYGTLGGSKAGVTTPAKKKDETGGDAWDKEKKQLQKSGAEAGKGFGTLRALLKKYSGGGK